MSEEKDTPIDVSEVSVEVTLVAHHDAPRTLSQVTISDGVDQRKFAGRPVNLLAVCGTDRNWPRSRNRWRLSK